MLAATMAPDGRNWVDCVAMANLSCLVRMNSSLAECAYGSADYKTTPMQKLPSRNRHKHLSPNELQELYLLGYPILKGKT